MDGCDEVLSNFIQTYFSKIKIKIESRPIGKIHEHTYSLDTIDYNAIIMQR